MLSWYSRALNFTNGISIFNHEFINHKILRIMDITCTDMQNTQDISKQIYTIYSMYEVLALSHQCECVNANITSTRGEWLSRNRRIKSTRSPKSYQLFAAYFPLLILWIWKTVFSYEFPNFVVHSYQFEPLRKNENAQNKIARVFWELWIVIQDEVTVGLNDESFSVL